MDINNYLNKNEYILKVLIDYCKEIEEYKKEIEREEEEIKFIITNYLRKKDIHDYETKYCKVTLRHKEEHKTKHNVAAKGREKPKNNIKTNKPKNNIKAIKINKPKNNMDKIILEIKGKNDK